jgi:hypothetical protein
MSTFIGGFDSFSSGEIVMKFAAAEPKRRLMAAATMNANRQWRVIAS